MTPQDQIRKLAEDLVPENIYGPVGREKAYQREDIVSWVYDAILEGVKLALAEPSQEMLVAGRIWSDKKYGKPVGNDGIIGCRHCLAAVRLRELGVEE